MPRKAKTPDTPKRPASKATPKRRPHRPVDPAAAAAPPAEGEYLDAPPEATQTRVQRDGVRGVER